MDFLNFPDKCVRYSTFLNDLAAKVVHMIKQDANDPEFISQNKAFQMSWQCGAVAQAGQSPCLQASGQSRIPYSRPAAVAEDTTRLP